MSIFGSLKKLFQAAIESFRVNSLHAFDVEGIAEQSRFVQAFDKDFLRLRAQFRHRQAFLIGDVAEQGAVAAGDRNQTDAALVPARANLGAREQCDGFIAPETFLAGSCMSSRRWMGSDSNEVCMRRGSFFRISEVAQRGD
jgi:hypothetical protein